VTGIISENPITGVEKVLADSQHYLEHVLLDAKKYAELKPDFIPVRN